MSHRPYAILVCNQSFSASLRGWSDLTKISTVMEKKGMLGYFFPSIVMNDDSLIGSGDWCMELMCVWAPQKHDTVRKPFKLQSLSGGHQQWRLAFPSSHRHHVTKSPSFALSMRQGNPLICAIRLREKQISTFHPAAQISGERCETLSTWPGTLTLQQSFFLRDASTDRQRSWKRILFTANTDEDLFTGIG